MLTRLTTSRIVIAPLLLGFGLGLNNQAAVAVSATTDTTNTTTNTEAVPITQPMSAAVSEGIGCLILATPMMVAAYAAGPTEIMMLVSGAVIVPSSSTQLFVALGGILGGASCGVGAALTPVTTWAIDQMVAADQPKISSNIAPAVFANQKRGAWGIPTSPTGGETLANSVVKNMPVANNTAVADNNAVQPAITTPHSADTVVEKTANAFNVDEDFVQSAGCLAGVTGLTAITLATVPVEIVGLAAGGVGIPTNTAILMLGIAGTIFPAGCGIGAAASLPILALSQYWGLDTLGRQLGSWIGWGGDGVKDPTITAYVTDKPVIAESINKLPTGI